MTVNLTSPAAIAPKFSGTGEDGKPRVLVAKAKYTEPQFEWFRYRTDIEFVGFVSDADVMEKKILEEKPDVVIVGSTFGKGPLDFRSPLTVLDNIFGDPDKSKGLTLPGIVVNSMYSANIVDAMRRTAHFLMGGNALEKLKSVHVPEVGDELAEAVKSVDPFPVSKD